MTLTGIPAMRPHGYRTSAPYRRVRALRRKTIWLPIDPLTSRGSSSRGGTSAPFRSARDSAWRRGSWRAPSVVVQVLDHGPSYGHPVVGTRSAAYLVQQDDAAVGEVVDDGGRFKHLDHKGRFALRDVVARPHAREYLVHHTDMRRRGGTKEPICAISMMRAVCRSRADLPAMLGPVIIMICCSLSSSNTSLGIYSSPTSMSVSMTGWRPSRMSMRLPSSSTGRT